MIREIAVRVLEFGYVCDHCLGRQFSRLGKENNAEKGKVIRRFLYMEDMAEKTGADPANFRDKHPKCVVCEDVFERLPEIAEKIAKKTAGMEFETFLLGIRMSDSLVMNEEALWERIDVRYSEPIKSEISRELAGMIAEKTGRRQDAKRPDVIITFDLQKNETEVFSNPIFIYGEYKKFVRGLPQTSSPHYRESVQDIIAKPFMKFSSAASNVFHALGREDKEARCLVWRPFILELKQPVRRKIDLKRMEKAINRGKRVKVRGLKFCKKKDVSELKARRPYKVYRLVVDFERKVENIEDAKKLAGTIKQRTPARVLGTKEDKTKYKKVKSIKWKKINNKRYRFEITAESGLYLRELISGDNGRTKPSISGLLKNRAVIKEFDLVGLEE